MWCILLHITCHMITQEYCRELVADDLEVLRPKYDNPLDDPSFYVPPLGRLYEPDDGSMQTHIATLQFGQDAVWCYANDVYMLNIAIVLHGCVFPSAMSSSPLHHGTHRFDVVQQVQVQPHHNQKQPASSLQIASSITSVGHPCKPLQIWYEQRTVCMM